MRAFLIGLLCFALPVQAADWEVASHEPGLTIYTRAVPGQDLKDFRGVLRVKASMREVVAALMDVEAMPQWFFNMKEARVLDARSSDNHLLYMVIKGIWPVSDRDAVVRMTMAQDPKTLVLSMTGSARPDAYPLMRERVRIPRMQSGWIVTPVSAQETDVRLDGNADPGGHIPLWIANLVVVSMPKNTLQNLRVLLQKQPYDTTKLSQDPRMLKMLAGVKYPEFAP